MKVGRAPWQKPAWGRLVDAFRANEQWLRSQARALSADPDDLLQEACLRSLSRGASSLDVKTLFRRLLLDARRDTLRAADRRVRREQDAAAGLSAESVEADCALHQARVAEVLRCELAALPAPLRECVMLTYFDELPSAEVASRLGVPAGTVRRRNQLALARLRARMEVSFQLETRASWRDVLASVFVTIRRTSRLAPGPTVASARWFGPAAALAVLAILLAASRPLPRTTAIASASSMPGQSGEAQVSLIPLPRAPDWRPVVNPVTAWSPGGLSSQYNPERATSGSRDPSTVASPVGCVPLQTLIDAARPGARVQVPRCLYRETVTVTKPLTLLAEPGAEIRGSDVWTDFTVDGGTWKSQAHVPDFATLRLPCKGGQEDGCHEPAQVFADGVAVPRVAGEPRGWQWSLDPDRRVVLGFDPAPHEIEVSTRQTWMLVRANDVTLQGFVMRHLANEKDAYGVEFDDRTRGGIIRDNLFRDASTHAVKISGSDHLIERNSFVDIGGTGLGFALTERFRARANRFLRMGGEYRLGRGWFGGSVVAILSSGTLERNEIEQGRGSGVFIIASHDVDVRDNRIHGNLGAGTIILQSRRVAITRNEFWNNGWAATPREPALIVSSGVDVTVDRNVLVDHPAAVRVAPITVANGAFNCDLSARIEFRGNDLIGPGVAIGLFGDPHRDVPALPCAANRALFNRVWTFGEPMPEPLGTAQMLLSEGDRDAIIERLGRGPGG